MEFKKDSSKLVKWLTPQLRKHMAYRFKTPKEAFETSFNKLLLILYNDIDTGMKYVVNKMGTKCLEPVLDENKKHISHNSTFFPKGVQDYINEHMTHVLIYTCKIRGKDIKIKFGLFGNIEEQNLEKYDEHACFIYSMLYICYKYNIRKCSDTLDISIYLTPIKKRLPKDRNSILGAKEVNTAYTFGCQPKGEIVLYRQEEWKKVFIHEVFHTFGFDFNKNIARTVYDYHKERFLIKSEFNIEEAYVETWGRILNCAYNSYFSLNNKSDWNTYLIYMKFSLQIERLFSLLQLIKVLKHMGLTYEMLFDGGHESKHLCKQLYRENSNIFAYYILTGVLMNDYYKFLSWCYSNNTILFKFNSSTSNVKSFVKLIDNAYENPSMIELINKLQEKDGNDFIKKTTRMTAIEVIPC